MSHFAYVANTWPDDRCAYCSLNVDWDKRTPHPRAPTADHDIPRCRGGRGGDNLVLACTRCNTEKGDLTGNEYRVYRKYLVRGVGKREAARLAQAEHGRFHSSNEIFIATAPVASSTEKKRPVGSLNPTEANVGTTVDETNLNHPLESP